MAWNPMRQAFDPEVHVDDLAAFLLSRIAEDEQTIRMTTNDGRLNAVGGVIAEQFGDVYSARRMLAECAAKRAIIDTFGPPHFITGGSSAAFDEVLKLLALPYADHPNYRAGWGVTHIARIQDGPTADYGRHGPFLL